MAIHYPHIPFERYADDTICHCRTQKEAIAMKDIIMNRLAECKLRLNEEKTRIVYCKDSRRKERQENISFDFLGYTFCPRKAQNSKTGESFTSFLPGISQKSKNHIHDTIHSWKLARKKNFIEMDIQMSSSVRGWMNYYGKFYPSSLKPTLQALNHAIVRWAVRKFKRFKGSYKRAWHWLIRRYVENPKLFYHWCCGIIPCYFKLKPVKIRRAG
jgi:RNA-directed DNA polymerase